MKLQEVPGKQEVVARPPLALLVPAMQALLLLVELEPSLSQAPCLAGQEATGFGCACDGGLD